MAEAKKQPDYKEANLILFRLTEVVGECDKTMSKLRNFFINNENVNLGEIKQTVKHLRAEALEISAKAEELLNGKN